MEDITLTRSDYVQIGAFLATIFGIFALSYWIAGRFHVDEDAVLMITFGVFVVIATLARVPFFWHHAKALFLRALVGDVLATGIYVVFGVGLVAGGIVRLNYWRDDVRTCQRMYAEARDGHERMRVLRYVPRAKITGILEIFGHYRALSCGRYRERGTF